MEKAIRLFVSLAKCPRRLRRGEVSAFQELYKLRLVGMCQKGKGCGTCRLRKEGKVLYGLATDLIEQYTF